MAAFKPPISRIPTPIKGPAIPVSIFPPALPPWRNTPRPILNAHAISASKRQLTVSAEGRLIPVTIGRDRIGGNVTDVFVYNNKLVFMVVWGVGPYQLIESIHLGSSPFTGTVRHYLGGNTEAIDPTLSAARSKYTANPTDIAFSVLEITTLDNLDGLNVTAIVQGRNDAFDPRLNGGAGANAYTSNAALLLGWYITKVLGESVNQASLTTCANNSNEALGTLTGDAVADRGLYRHRIGLTLSQGQNKQQTLLTLQEYAQVFLAREGASVRMIPDKDAPAVGSVTPGNVIAGTFVKSIAGLSQVPNMLSVTYTDINTTPWKDAVYTTPTPAGAVREQRVSMPGIQSLAQAKRFGIVRLNKYTVARLTGSFDMADEGIKYLTGEIILLTDNEGMSTKKVRILKNPASGKNRWRYGYVEHDAVIYSDAVAGEPSVSDTSLPSPADIPVGPAITAVNEVLFTDETGTTYSRFEIKFTGSSWAFTGGYRVKVSDGTDIILETNVAHLGDGIAHSVPTPATSQGVLYTVEIWLVNVLGKVGSTASSTTQQGAGKAIPPTDVTGLIGFEAGQFVNLTWNDAIDSDLRGYEIRRLAEASYTPSPAGAWDHVSKVVIAERVDTTKISIPAEPVGTYYYMVKARDRAKNYSTNSADVRIDVTADEGGAIVIESLLENTLVNMHVYEIHGANGGRYAVTSGGEKFSDKFSAGQAFSAVYSPGDRWGADENVASSVESVEWDNGSDRQGNWFWSATVDVFSGTITYTTKLALAAAHPTFTDFSGQSANVAARYLKVKAEIPAALGNGFQIKLPVDATHQGAILEQTIQSSVLATGQPLAVTYPQPYAGIPEVVPRYQGSNSYFAVADSITVTGYNLHVWDTAGVAKAGTVRTTVKGA